MFNGRLKQLPVIITCFFIHNLRKFVFIAFNVNNDNLSEEPSNYRLKSAIFNVRKTHVFSVTEFTVCCFSVNIKTLLAKIHFIIKFVTKCCYGNVVISGKMQVTVETNQMVNTIIDFLLVK